MTKTNEPLRIVAECPDDGGRYLMNPDGKTWTCERPHEDGWHTIGTPDVLLDDGERAEGRVDGDGATVLYIVRDEWPGDDDEQTDDEAPSPVGNPDGFCTEPCAGVGVIHPYHGIGVPPVPPSRSYVVGLPVIITVAHDGSVTYELDTSEASVAVWKDDQTEYDEEDVKQDSLKVEADYQRRRAEQARS